MKIILNNIDVTRYILNDVNIDDSVPEFGSANQLLNDTLEIKFPINYERFLLQDIPYELIYTERDIVKFHGFLAQTTFDHKSISCIFRSRTAVLFNSHIRNVEILGPYVKDEAYPADIIKEILFLHNLKFNEESYLFSRTIHTMYKVTLSVTNEKWIVSELLDKIAEVTCSRIYIWNDEYYYEQYNKDGTPRFVLDITDDYFTVYPTITTFDYYASKFKGTEIRFGKEEITLKNLRYPEKVIDLGRNTNNGVYTNRADTAQFIADQYDALLSKKKLSMTCSLRKEIGDSITKYHTIRWKNKIWYIVNIKRSSNLEVPIECVSFYGWNSSSI